MSTQRIGSYDVVAKLGEGGMGEVYRANDSKLKRQVAIKVLPASVAADGDRLARFQREAEVLAALNHPNIAGIYGLEDTDGTKALVMELVEGPTLAEIIAQGAVPLSDAVPMAKQIAAALEAAHDQNIVHRDLKPANIKVRPDGVVKVLDFGLAKALDAPGASGTDAMNSPTLTARATQMGVILGTAAYMAPEQARGKPVDRRADVWAFGAVLFEMLTGARAFPGDDITDTLAAVVRAEPDWTLLPNDLMPTLALYLRRCLHKDPKQRVGDMHDVRLALEGAFDVPAPPAATGPLASAAPGARLAWAVAAGLLVAAVALGVPGVQHLREAPAPLPPEIRTEINASGVTDFALAPDGRHVVLAVSGVDGIARLWLRSLADTTLRPLAGTDRAARPFWSPDSRSIAFFTGEALKRFDLDTAQVRTVAPAASTGGGTWNAAGDILFAATPRPAAVPLRRVPATGGTPTPLAPLGDDAGHFSPVFLPDGRQFLFTGGRPDNAGLYLAALDGGTPVRLSAEGDFVQFLPDRASADHGWVVWSRAEHLVAQRLDLTSRALTGEVVQVAEAGLVSVAPGLIATRAGGASTLRQFAWFDRQGTQLSTFGEPSRFNMFDLSPDGRHVAVVMADDTVATRDIWLLEVARGLRTRFTFSPAQETRPLWSQDGRFIVYAASPAGHAVLYRKAVDGPAGSEEVLLDDAREKHPLSVSPDGKYLLFGATDPQTGSDLWVLPLTGTRTPVPFARTPFTETQGAFSPDGRWIAYVSNESGAGDVYAAPFPGPGGKTLISTKQAGVGQGGVPMWRPDSREIFYIAPDRTLMGVEVAPRGTTLEAGLARKLFGPILAVGGRNYAVSADGRRFLTLTVPGLRADLPITLIQHWQPPGR